MKAIPHSKLPSDRAEARAKSSLDALSAAPVEVLCADLAAPVNFIDSDSSSKLSQVSVPREVMVSSCGDREGRVSLSACPSQLPRAGCAELVHELSNLVTAVLLNAQMLEWKLPPYSHIKRPIREMARSAQRASELLRRLTGRCAAASQGLSAPVSGASRENGSTHRASVDLTAECDPCTSSVFPKRDDKSAG